MTEMTHQMEAEAPVTGRDLIAWGHRPGRAFPELIARANAALARGESRAEVEAALAGEREPRPLDLHPEGAVDFARLIEPEGEDEVANVAKVEATMAAVMRTPTVLGGAVLPDACPAGPVGTIPVGGVVAARDAIHPGMHSADICCSVMMTDLGDTDPAAVLDAAASVTHFGPGGRAQGRRFTVSLDLMDAFRANPFLDGKKLIHAAQSHMGTQGDGNHFLFVGRSAATGRTAMVTHHGSRGPGAMLYKRGMEVAERFRRRLSPRTLRQNAWIPADSPEGRDYWEALQLVRRWTRANHTALHRATAEACGAEPGERVWNEHNFVFERDGVYLHGKGATPAWDGYAEDATGLTLIPLNMAQPVLVARGRDARAAWGFAPHGAGRNFSRSEHKRRMEGTPEAALARETRGLDIRFAAGGIDVSELPSSYKDAGSVIAGIERHGLADIVDRIEPAACIMAGDVPPVWSKGRRRGGRH
jgi:RNA-splicing ligase RtcB